MRDEELAKKAHPIAIGSDDEDAKEFSWLPRHDLAVIATAAFEVAERRVVASSRIEFHSVASDKFAVELVAYDVEAEFVLALLAEDDKIVAAAVADETDIAVEEHMVEYGCCAGSLHQFVELIDKDSSHIDLSMD